jgi:vacuolar iron transporter family protein
MGARKMTELEPSMPSDDLSTTAAHLEAVRSRARWMIASEGAGTVPYEILHACNAARDGAIMILVLDMVLLGADVSHKAALLAAAVAFACYTGVANALAVAAQLRYWESELHRERAEIRSNPEMEREEVQLLYEAKGFSGPMLEQIVDTLCADEDRLLKVMLEEELGIFMEQTNHPVAIGLLTGVCSLVAGLAVAAVASASVSAGIVGLVLLLAIIAIVQSAGVTRVSFEVFGRWALAGGGIAAVAYFLASLLR